MPTTLFKVAHMRFEVDPKALTFKASALLDDRQATLFSGPIPLDMPAQLRAMADAVGGMQIARADTAVHS
jgi:hypothetical protein